MPRAAVQMKREANHLAREAKLRGLLKQFMMIDHLEKTFHVLEYSSRGEVGGMGGFSTHRCSPHCVGGGSGCAIREEGSIVLGFPFAAKFAARLCANSDEPGKLSQITQLPVFLRD